MSATWDQSVFDRTLRQYLLVSPLTFQQSLNKKGYDLTVRAGGATAKTARNQIVQELGPVATRITSQRVLRSRTGKLRPGKLNAETVYAQLLYSMAAARLRAKGVKFSHDQLQAKAKKIYTGKLKSTAFIKSGWIPAREILKRSDRGNDPAEPFTDSDLLRFGKLPKITKQGGADPAKRSFNPSVSIFNTVPNAKYANVGATQKGQAGLQIGFAKVTADMIPYIERKMRPDAARFNAQQR